MLRYWQGSLWIPKGLRRLWRHGSSGRLPLFDRKFPDVQQRCFHHWLLVVFREEVVGAMAPSLKQWLHEAGAYFRLGVAKQRHCANRDQAPGTQVLQD